MSDIFARLRGAVPDHSFTTVLGTVVSFYLSESPPIAVKEIVVLAIENEKDMNFTANQYVTSHQHEDPNISSVVAWEKSPLQDKQCVAPLRSAHAASSIACRYTLRLAFPFMNRLSLAQVIDGTTFAKVQFPEAALQSLAVQMLSGLWYVTSLIFVTLGHCARPHCGFVIS